MLLYKHEFMYIQSFEHFGEIRSAYLEIDKVMTHAICMRDGLARPSSRSSKPNKTTYSGNKHAYHTCCQRRMNMGQKSGRNTYTHMCGWESVHGRRALWGHWQWALYWRCSSSTLLESDESKPSRKEGKRGPKLNVIALE